VNHLTSLTRRYVAALSIVAGLALIRWLAVQQTISDRRGDAALLNVAVRQNVRAQRMSAIALRLAIVAPAHDSALQEELLATARTWETSQQAIHTGDSILGIRRRISHRARVLLTDVEPTRIRMLDAALSMSARTDTSSAATIRARAVALDADSRLFLAGMDRVLRQIEEESSDRIGRLQLIATALFFVTWLTLAAAVILFLPATRRVEQLIEGIATERATLELRNREIDSARSTVTEVLARQASAFADLARSEGQLRDSEERLRSIADVLDEGIAMLDARGIIRWCNPSAGRILGVRPIDVLGHRLLDLPWRTQRVDGSELPRELHPSLEVLRSGVAQHATVVGLVSSDHNVRWLSVNAHPLRESAGAAITGVVASFRDVTATRNAEAARDAHAARLAEQTVMLEAQNESLAMQAEELSHQTEELERMREFLQGVIDHSVDGIAAFDTKLRYTEWNPGMERITGFSAADVLGRRAYDVFPDIVDTGRDRAYESALDGMTTALTSQPYRVPETGRDGYIDAGFSPLRDAAGAVIGGILIVRDVTERKRADVALRERELIMRAFVKHTPAAVVMCDRDMRVIAVSDQWRAQYIGSDRDVYGVAYEELRPDGKDRWASIHQACLERGAESSGEELFTQPDGTEYWLRWAVQPWYEANRRTGGVIMFSEDITARKRAEQGLRESEQRFLALATHAPVGIFQTDAAGTATFINETYRTITGLAIEESRGDAWVRSVHPDDRTRVLDAWVDAAAAGRPFNMEYRAVRPDGVLRWVLCAADTLRGGGNEIIGYIGSLTDITDRKQAEEALRALSVVDELTGLANRRGFLALADHQVKASARTGTELVLFFADMNDFKYVNDTFGHSAGDDALREMSGVLRATFRDSDIVARLGGDEFVMLAVAAGGETEAVVQQRIQNVLDQLNAEPGRRFPLSISIGAARFDPVGGESLESLMSRADSRLYDEKRRRRSHRASTAA
jgi:diguanylate cyclase (GGDEF)-like protein/PAS domain S-box-containing protein